MRASCAWYNTYACEVVVGLYHTYVCHFCHAWVVLRRAITDCRGTWIIHDMGTFTAKSHVMTYVSWTNATYHFGKWHVSSRGNNNSHSNFLNFTCKNLWLTMHGVPCMCEVIIELYRTCSIISTKLNHYISRIWNIRLCW